MYEVIGINFANSKRIYYFSPDNLELKENIKVIVETERGMQIGVTCTQILTMPNGGNAGIRGGKNGDLHIYINVKQHKLFERDGIDLNLKVYVPFYTLLAGGEVEVPLTKGTTTIKIPELTQSNTIFKLKGKGIKDLNSNSYGNINVTIVGEAPKTLNKATKKLLEQLKDELDSDDFSRYKGYLKDLDKLD